MSSYWTRNRLAPPVAASSAVILQENIVELIGLGIIGRLNATQKIQADTFEITGFLNVTLKNSHRLVFVVHGVNTALAGVKRGFVSIANGSFGGTSIFEFHTSYQPSTQQLTIYVKDALGQIVTLSPGTYRIQINFFASLGCSDRCDDFCFPIPPCHPISRC